MLNIILFGKPGAGKGTQADYIKNYFDLVHISTGDLFRNNIKNETQMGLIAKSYMDEGKLVPDEVTIDMLKSEVINNSKANGFIFDGFPRTISQAEVLDIFLDSMKMNIRATISLDVEDFILEDRLIKRGKTSGRLDDQNINKIRNRFKEYNKKTLPLINYYKSLNKFYSISGTGTIDEIRDKLVNMINQLKLND
ncbi:MAG: adenylate kinase [Flavobacteriaceae bacterium]|jgi:adenylate kinase|nr:adenylate kinase [Flavobacteriaceae bacterium]|tara:strand:- start:299 stop:883 length:585 start_codon:yes stop_codon:yes gene_type:complete